MPRTKTTTPRVTIEVDPKTGKTYRVTRTGGRGRPKREEITSQAPARAAEPEPEPVAKMKRGKGKEHETQEDPLLNLTPSPTMDEPLSTQPFHEPTHEPTMQWHGTADESFSSSEDEASGSSSAFSSSSSSSSSSSASCSSSSSSSSSHAHCACCSKSSASAYSPEERDLWKFAFDLPENPKKPPRMQPSLTGAPEECHFGSTKIVKSASVTLDLVHPKTGETQQHTIDLFPYPQNVHSWLTDEASGKDKALKHLLISHLRWWVLNQPECSWCRKGRSNTTLFQDLCQNAKRREQKRRKKRVERGQRQTGLNIPLDEAFVRYYKNIIFNEFQ